MAGKAPKQEKVMRRNNGRTKTMYGVSRIDNDEYRTHAWRVSLRRRGKCHVKNFSDKKWGGKGRALKEAKLFRDELLVQYPPMSRKEFCSILRSNNTSGITGVYTYAKSFTLRDGRVKESWYWEANWPSDVNGQTHQSFSVNEFGEDKARRLAVRARAAALKHIEGHYWASNRGVVE